MRKGANIKPPAAPAATRRLLMSGGRHVDKKDGVPLRLSPDGLMSAMTEKQLCCGVEAAGTVCYTIIHPTHSTPSPLFFFFLNKYLRPFFNDMTEQKISRRAFTFLSTK